MVCQAGCLGIGRLDTTQHQLASTRAGRVVVVLSKIVAVGALPLNFEGTLRLLRAGLSSSGLPFLLHHGPGQCRWPIFVRFSVCLTRLVGVVLLLNVSDLVRERDKALLRGFMDGEQRAGSHSCQGHRLSSNSKSQTQAQAQVQVPEPAGSQVQAQAQVLVQLQEARSKDREREGNKAQAQDHLQEQEATGNLEQLQDSVL